MFDITIQSAGVYRMPQQGKWTAPMPTLSLYAGGLIWRRLDGILTRSPSPNIALLPAGTHSEFRYGSDRENWVVLIKTDDVQPAKKSDSLRIRTHEGFIEIPRCVNVSPPELARFREMFREIVADVRDPSLISRARACATVYTIIGLLIGRHAGRKPLSPAGRLKELIDTDSQWQRCLEDMSRSCGFSPDHMRRKFHREFGMNPHEYRRRRRIAMMVGMLTETTLSIKEIAANLGFTHVSHMCMTCKNATGESPVQVRTRFRGSDAPT